jgi:hypothetical protein
MTEYLAKSVESTLARAYGTASTAETGRNTVGHQCILSSEQEACNAKKTGLLTYGELLPDGVSKLFDAEHLDVFNATTLLDLGMGTGKVLMQAFLAAPNDTPTLRTLIGVELAESRFAFAEAAAHCLVEQEPNLYHITASEPGKCVQVRALSAKLIYLFQDRSFVRSLTSRCSINRFRTFKAGLSSSDAETSSKL